MFTAQMQLWELRILSGPNVRTLSAIQRSGRPLGQERGLCAHAYLWTWLLALFLQVPGVFPAGDDTLKLAER